MRQGASAIVYVVDPVDTADADKLYRLLEPESPDLNPGWDGEALGAVCSGVLEVRTFTGSAASDAEFIELLSALSICE